MVLKAENAVFILLAIVVSWLVLYPIAELLTAAVTTDQGYFSLIYIRATLNEPGLAEIIWNTVVVSITATAIAVGIGVVFAYFVARTDMPMGSLFELISIVPFLTPPIVAGLAWQQLAERQSGLINLMLEDLHIRWHVDIMSLGGIIFVTSLYLVPFVFLISVGALRSINPEIEEASLIAGCSRIRTLLHVSFPLILPAISSAALIAFTYSNILFGIHATLGIPVNIWFLTTAIYHAVNVIPAEMHRAAVLSCLLMIIAAASNGLHIYLWRNSATFQTISGKGMRGNKHFLGRWRWMAWAFCAAYVVVVTVLPYTILFFRSLKPFMFQPGMSWTDLVSGWDLRAYWSILNMSDSGVTRAIANSFVLGIGTAVICMGLASLIAFIVIRTKIRGRSVLTFLSMAPMALPGVVLGIAVLRGYSHRGLMLYGTLWYFLVAYLISNLPLGVNSISSSFVQIQSELEEASRLCGASWFRQWRTVTLPLIKPGFVVGSVIVFASVLREIGVSIILYTPGTEVVAYVLFNQWENGDLQALSAFVILTTALTLLLITALLRLGRLRFVDLAATEVRQS